MFGQPGTNLYGLVFCLAAAIGLVFLVRFIYRQWKDYLDRAELAESSVPPTALPSPVGPIVTTLVVVGLFICVSILSWNILQGITTNSSNYRSAGEISEQKMVDDAQMPTNDQLDQARADLKSRAETVPHEQALDNFDAKMKEEADKIRRRSLDNTAATTPSTHQ